MCIHMEYEEEVSNLSGGEPLTLRVHEKGGSIGIGLAPVASDDHSVCDINPAQAEEVVRALNQLIKRART